MTLYFLILVAASFIHLAFIIGIIGLSWYYWKDKSTDIDGNKFYTYNEATRNNGFTLGIMSIVALIAIYFFLFYVVLSFL